MPRPQKCRKICTPPKMLGFNPFGIEGNEKGQIILLYEEYESIKLVNYENLPQDDAALRMEVSRPTFTRIYNIALKKIAEALTEGKSIIIQGGNFKFDHNWYKCKRCFKLIQGEENHTKCKNCNHYNMDELINLNPHK